ncbi:MAG TPA: BLUF domain-containing protein [Pseudolabrys sp.]|nr:BLUF domain-containing protein [Pseudolabrys sp.]
MLTRLIYHSENHLASNRKLIAGLNGIMDRASRNNQRDGITGALLFDTLWFVQILEGDREKISATLRRIMHDERHDAVTIMDCRPIAERLFAKSWMGLAMLHGGNQPLYAKHGMVAFNPQIMTEAQVIGLACDLAHVGFQHRLADLPSPI